VTQISPEHDIFEATSLSEYFKVTGIYVQERLASRHFQTSYAFMKEKNSEQQKMSLIHLCLNL
jgi:hypothetical protein